MCFKVFSWVSCSFSGIVAAACFLLLSSLRRYFFAGRFCLTKDYKAWKNLRNFSENLIFCFHRQIHVFGLQLSTGTTTSFVSRKKQTPCYVED